MLNFNKILALYLAVGSLQAMEYKSTELEKKENEETSSESHKDKKQKVGDTAALRQYENILKFMKAIKVGNLEEVTKMLLNGKANANLVDHYGHSALINAVMYGHIEIVEELLKAGAHIHEIDHEGNPPLAWAARLGNKEITELLIKFGADVNPRDKGARKYHKWGRSYPLHEASRNGHIQIVKLLLENGAKINIENYYKETALSLATQFKHNEVVNLLKSHGATVQY